MRAVLRDAVDSLALQLGFAVGVEWPTTAQSFSREGFLQSPSAADITKTRPRCRPSQCTSSVVQLYGARAVAKLMETEGVRDLAAGRILKNEESLVVRTGGEI